MGTRVFTLAGLVVLGAWDLAGGVLAQGVPTWRAMNEDVGGLLRADVFAPEFSLGFTCTAPSPLGGRVDGRDAHQSRASVPYGLFVRISGAMVDRSAVWSGQGGAPVLGAVTLGLDGVGYRLPPFTWVELSYDWWLELSMADPMIAALEQAGDLVLDAGTGVAWRYPTDGLAEGLQTVMANCASAWAQAGFAAPDTSAAAPAPVAPVPAGLLTPELDAHLQRTCQAGYTLHPEAIAAHDLDRDGVADRIVDWRGVTCDASSPLGPIPFCGAAYCAIDVFLSTRPGDPQSMLGVGYEVTQAANGAPGLRFGGTVGGCARGDCDKIFWWDGTRFRE